MTCRCPSQRGFTLIEMLVTLVLMALMSLLAWRALGITEQTVRRSGHQMANALLLARTLDQIGLDIAAHRPFQGIQPLGAGQAHALNAPALPAGLGWRPGTLEVARLDAAGEPVRVIWQLRGSVLQRVPFPAGQTNTRTAAPAHDTLTNVTGFELRAWLPPRGWIAPDAIPAGSQASGVEIRLSLAAGDATHLYRKVVLLP